MGLKLKIPRGLRRLGRRAADAFPPTVRGVAVAVAASYALWRWGYGEMDLLIFVVSLSGLVLFSLACVVVSGAAVYLSRHFRGQPETAATAIPRLEAGSPIPSGFSTPSLGKVPLVKIAWRWLEPPGMECRQEMRDGRLRETVIARRRTLVTEIEREIAVRDAFGLCRITWRRRVPTALQALPHRGRLGNLPPVTSLASAEGLPHPAGAPEGDRMEVRRYVPGDSVRFILWKTWARTGQLNVRVPEKAVDPSQRTVAYLLSGPGDEPAAAAARVALEQNLLGQRWLFAADGTAEPTEELGTAQAAICRSGLFPRPEIGPAEGLQAFFRHPRVSGEAHCVVFAAACPGPWVDAALGAARAFGGAVSFVLGTDGVLSDDPRPLWRRLLFFEPGPELATSHHELRRLTASLEAAGHPVLVVDRTSGRSHGRLDPRAAAGRRHAA